MKNSLRVSGRRIGRDTMENSRSQELTASDAHPPRRRRQRGGKRLEKPDRQTLSRQFPESGSRLVQFFLLLRGLIPLWRSLAGERFERRRSETLRMESAKHARVSRRSVLGTAAFFCSALCIALLVTVSTLYTRGTVVTYRGQRLDTVRSIDEAQRAAAKVEGLTTAALGSVFRLSDELFDYTPTLVQRSEVKDTEELERALTEEIGLVTYAYSLYVDGELIGSTEYEGALDDLLEQIKRHYVSPDTLKVSFNEDIRIEEGYVPANSLSNLGNIAEILNSTKSAEETYTVASGDTWGKIAMDHGMNNEALLALNPGYDVDDINPGDELVISKEVSYLTVVVTERQNYVEDIPYEVNYIDDDSMYKDETKLLSEGVYGQADIVVDVTYINGSETERSVISSVKLSDPVTEQRVRGTKERPSWAPTGSFRWPASGRITSYFGYRNTGIRGASRNHMGIDIACPYGSPIYAADGGTVIYTGYKGAMGYTVIIDHGNGLVTYYEHCSSFLCRSGDHVYKGQQIAKVGRTGVASGSHCHFGVQRNGSYVNPMGYLQ